MCFGEKESWRQRHVMIHQRNDDTPWTIPGEYSSEAYLQNEFETMTTSRYTGPLHTKFANQVNQTSKDLRRLATQEKFSPEARRKQKL